MGDKNDFVKGPPSIISEIEGQLDEILSKKRASVEKALEEKIRMEEEEARRRMQEIDQEMAAEKEALLSYRNILTEFEDEKVKIKKQIQKHLDRAAKIQSEIESKTTQTLEELNRVSELNGKLEGINQETEQKVVSLKEDLEQKYGISPTIPEYRGEDMGVQIGIELDKLNKIKELLETNGNFETESVDIEPGTDNEVITEGYHEDEPETEVQAQEGEEVTEATGEPVDEEAKEEGIMEVEAVTGEEEGKVEGEEALAEEEPETEVQAQEGEEATDTTEESVGEEEVRTELEEAKAEEELIEAETQEEVKIEEHEIEAVDEEAQEEEMMEVETLAGEEEVKEEDVMEVETFADEEEAKVEGEETATEETKEEEAKFATEAEADSENDERESEAEIIRLDADEREIGTEASSPPEEESTDNGTELNLMNTLDKYRKSEGTKHEDEISFFENEDRMTLDGDYIIATIHNNVNEAKKLYIQLSQTKSPKEQFFIKQEIIRHQEAIRKLMLNVIRICEKDTFFLPYYTQDILNVDVFKVILEKVSMENWSNQEDFNNFDDYDSRLKDAFYERITPPTEYLNSIMRELKITA